MRYMVNVVFHQDFVEVDGKTIIVGLKSKPIRNAANRELIKKLAKYFKVSTSQIRIMSGLQSEHKLVEIG